MTDTSMPCVSLGLPFPARVELLGRPSTLLSPSPMPKVTNSVSSPLSSIKEKNTKLRDNAVTMQLTKTKMCAFFERGKCASTNCRYAHSQSELRLPPNLQKTKLCRAFLSSGCTDENCFFAHGESDLRVTEGIYKTQICNFFERGYCKKGDRCNHAHGSVDLRPATPVAESPLGKMSPSNFFGASSRPGRSPLPLSELLVIDSEANMMGMSPGMSPAYGGMAPTPTKSVTELARLAYSPAHASPFFGGYGSAPCVLPLSPIGALGPMNDMASMWAPRDAVDMLVQDPYVSPACNTNLMYTMDVMEPRMDLLEQQMLTVDHTPQKTLELLSLASPAHRPAPGLAQTEPPRTAPPLYAGPSAVEQLCCSPPGLEPAAEARDPLMVNLSERLASLDAVVSSLSTDISAMKSDPKRLHRI